MNIAEKIVVDRTRTESTARRRADLARALSLFEHSPLKQKKWQMLSEFLTDHSIGRADCEGKTCLDIGSDNGVISYLLRKKLGGVWYSTDLIPETVESIRSLVGERVLPMDGPQLPFPDNLFDVVVVVDMFEHLEDDAAFALELRRILKDGGVLITNVPDPKPGLLRGCRSLMGQTDEAHGHVRPGYSAGELDALLGDAFVRERETTYSKLFSNLVDTAITFGVDMMKGGRGQKGTVVSSNDLKKFDKSFRMYSRIAPLLRVCTSLDDRCGYLRGSMRIGRYRLRAE